MNLTEFPWWLSNGPAAIWRKISQAVLDFIEDKIRKAFALARIGTTTQTGLDIFWEDARIKPPVDPALVRIFLQTYQQFMAKVGKPTCDDLVKVYFNLVYCTSMDLRDHPILREIYPFWVVRFWIPPETDLETQVKIKAFIKVILPARCTQHFQLLTFTEPKGFGRTPFGRNFGR